MIELLVFIGVIVALSFCILPFAIFGIKPKLDALLFENEKTCFQLKQILIEIKRERARIVYNLNDRGTK